MKVLKKGESSRKETVVNSESLQVECHHASAHPSLGDGARYQLHWSIDFSDCPQSQILRAAAEYCIIANRRNFVKDSKPQDVDWTDCTVEAQDLIPTPTSKADKVLKSLAGFSAEELADMGIVLAAKE